MSFVDDVAALPLVLSTNSMERSMRLMQNKVCGLPQILYSFFAAYS